ncbi:hypothetical protein [Lysobacter gummosus]|uniref:hypothetical protein n=1 Tax=Lysobacter gummosus TaxID=262324 RepID=UPI003636BF42
MQSHCRRGPWRVRRAARRGLPGRIQRAGAARVVRPPRAPRYTVRSTRRGALRP